MISELTIDITVPPSVNRLNFNVKGVGRVKTREYGAWIRRETQELMVQRVKPVTPPVSIHIYVPETIRGDLSNRIKAPEDLLVKARIIPGDDKRYVRSISADFHKEEFMRVVVKSLAKE